VFEGAAESLIHFDDRLAGVSSAFVVGDSSRESKTRCDKNVGLDIDEASSVPRFEATVLAGSNRSFDL
jgi:hypothetical protein